MLDSLNIVAASNCGPIKTGWHRGILFLLICFQNTTQEVSALLLGNRLQKLRFSLVIVCSGIDSPICGFLYHAQTFTCKKIWIILDLTDSGSDRGFIKPSACADGKSGLIQQKDAFHTVSRRNTSHRTHIAQPLHLAGQSVLVAKGNVAYGFLAFLKVGIDCVDYRRSPLSDVFECCGICRFGCVLHGRSDVGGAIHPIPVVRTSKNSSILPNSFFAHRLYPLKVLSL